MASINLSEDDIYRTSTQYRLWSFSAPGLHKLRQSTHETATERVVAALKRHHAAKAGVNDDGPAPPIHTLTLDESQQILAYYCQFVIRLTTKTNKRSFQFDPAVGATAVQYLRRFYLSNSPMTYHPKEMLFTCLWLALKVEHVSIDLKSFVDKLNQGMNIKNVSEESVLAPEFIIVQGLRFTFEVRHAFRAMRAGGWELTALAQGRDEVLVNNEGKTGDAVQEEMILLPLPDTPWLDDQGNTHPAPVADTRTLLHRIDDAITKATDYLEDAAQLTDAYFLYTPSQIWLGALHLADAPLATYYLALRFSALPIFDKLRDTIGACTALLSQYEQAKEASKSKEKRAELTAIDKKLWDCRNPDKADLVGLHAAAKRGPDDRAADEARAAKRQKTLGDEGVFGGPLKAEG